MNLKPLKFHTVYIIYVFLSQRTWSALTVACRRGNEDVVKILVDAGADVNMKKKVDIGIFE